MLKLKCKKNNIVLGCYGICVFIYSVRQTTIMDTVLYNNTVVKCIMLICMAISLLIEISSIQSQMLLKTFCTIITLTVVIVGNVLMNGASIDLIYIVFFLIVCRRINPKKILTIYSKAVFLAVILTLFLWRCGAIENTMVRGNEGLGFIYSTFGPNLFLHACITYVAGSEKKIGKIKILLMIALSTWLYMRTATLSPLVFTYILCIGYLICSSKKIGARVELSLTQHPLDILCEYMAFIFAGITVVAQLLYNRIAQTSLGAAINAALSNRPIMGYQAFSRYPITLFGQPILWNTQLSSSSSIAEYFYVDSSYLQILLRYGVVMLLILCFAMTMVGKYAVKRKDTLLALGLFVFLAHCIADPQLLSFRYDPFLICVAACISANASYKTEERSTL